jgi:hypothetical protein
MEFKTKNWWVHSSVACSVAFCIESFILSSIAVSTTISRCAIKGATRFSSQEKRKIIDFQGPGYQLRSNIVEKERGIHKKCGGKWFFTPGQTGRAGAVLP